MGMQLFGQNYFGKLLYILFESGVKILPEIQGIRVYR